MLDYLNKDFQLKKLNNYMYAKTLSMFNYEGLPETLDRVQLEHTLQKLGYIFIIEHKNELYGVTGHLLGNEKDAYNRPTKIRVDNIALNIHKEFDLAKDGVLIKNDDLMLGIDYLLEKYNSLLIETEITMYLDNYNQRINTLISASDDTTRESAERYLEQIQEGRLGVIGENKLFESLQTRNAKVNTQNSITQLIELSQYLKAGLNNELGMDSNHNMKRERLNKDEVNKNVDTIKPFVDNMLFNRQQAVEKIYEMFGVGIGVEFGSVWAKNNEEEQENMEQLEELKTYVDETISEISDRVAKLESVVLKSDNEEKDEEKDEEKNEEKDEEKDEALRHLGTKDDKKDEEKDEEEEEKRK